MRKGGLGARRLVAPILVLPRAANVRSGWLPVVEWPHDNPIYLTYTYAACTRPVGGVEVGVRWVGALYFKLVSLLFLIFISSRFQSAEFYSGTSVRAGFITPKAIYPQSV